MSPKKPRLEEPLDSSASIETIFGLDVCPDPKIGPIPNELLYDTLCFLDRKKIEEFRVVSQRWNSLVLHNSSRMSKLLARKIIHDPSKEWMVHQSTDSEGPRWSLESIDSYLMENFFAEKVKFRPVQSELEAMNEVVSRIGTRIGAKEVVLDFRWPTDEWIGDEGLKKWSHVIVKTLVQTYSLRIKIYAKDFQKYFSIFHFTTRKPLIYITKWDVEYEDGIVYYEDPRLTSYLKRYGRFVNFTVDYQVLNIDFGINMIQRFVSEERPKKMIRWSQLTMKGVSREAITDLNKTLKELQQNFTKRLKMWVPKKGKYFARVYKQGKETFVEREDGWRLVIYAPNIWGDVKTNKLYFNVGRF